MFSANRLCYGLVLILLIGPSYLPFVSANSDGVSIDVNSISLEDFETIETDYYQLEFMIEVIGSPLSSTSSGNVTFDLQTIAGVSIDSRSVNFSLSSGSQSNITENFTNLPYGYSVINVELTGDIASSSPTHVSSFQRTIQRLKPLDISLGQSNEIILEGVDSTGSNTGNLTVNDGDYIQLQIPIINNGDFDWDGIISINVSDSVSYVNHSSDLIIVPAMQTIIYFYNSTIYMNEGIVSLAIELNNSNDGDSSDESIFFTSDIEPPPLPIISLTLSEVTSEIIAGENMEWNLSLSNTGQKAFEGNINCLFESQLVMNFSLGIVAGSTTFITVSTTARPGILECIVLDDRISTLSQSTVNISLQLESAEFEAAGGNIPATLSGPWHEGDSVEFSLLVRNHGDKTGTVKLVCEAGGITYSGLEIELSVDQAGEVTVEVPLQSQGIQTINWSLQSVDGSIDSGLSGMINLSVAERQTITISIPSISWNEKEGLSFDWGIAISEGIDRDVRVRLGYIDSLQEIYLVDTIMTLPSGLTQGTIDIGFVSGQKVVVRVTEENWVSGFGFSSLSLDIPDERPLYSLSFDSQTNPNRPSFGQQTEVKVNLENKGQILGSDGVLILQTSTGIMLAERDTSPIESQSNRIESFTIYWPEGEQVSLIATWSISSQSISADEIFISSIIEIEEESNIPWSGIFGGVVIAAVIILIIRLRNNNTGISQEKKDKEIKTVEKETEMSEIKIQVGCPECSRQLRIPSNYSGSVRCPDCTHSFEVEERKDPTREFEEPEDEQEDEAIPLGDGKIEVGCPDCSQTLRIPNSYTGSVRCPACKSIFKAA